MTFLTTKSLPRRTVLRGLGATMALPFLEAMLPAFSRRGLAAAKPAHPLQTFYVPNRIAMEYSLTKGEGNTLALSTPLAPPAAYRRQLLVLCGLESTWNYIHTRG